MFPDTSSDIFIPGPAGQLQAVTAMPKTDQGKHAAVICHPHPQMQGTMHNKVVTTLAKLCLALGMPVVRFNYRGVEQSEGAYGDGVGELADTLAVLQWLQACFPERKLWLAGFSFGGAIAYQAANQFPVAQLITVAPSVIHFELAHAPEVTCPWILVQGESDEVVPSKDVYNWVSGLSHPPTLIKVDACSHFFHGKLVELKQRVLDAIANTTL